MSEKYIGEQFSKEIDCYIKGVTSIGEANKADSKEYEEFLDMGKDMVGQNYCSEACSQRLREKFSLQLKEERENEKMKKVKSLKKSVMVAASVALLGAVMAQTTLGQNMVTSIVAIFTTGHNNVLQLDEEVDRNQRETMIENSKNEPMPEEYKGKIFDIEGNEFEYFPPYLEGAYNSKGEKLLCVRDGEVYTEEEWNKVAAEEEGSYTEITDMSKLSDHTSFNVTLPSYLPDGVSFNKAGVWSEENVTDNVCIEIIFTNSKGDEAIYLQERLKCEGAGIETGTYDEIKEVDINGAKGLMFDNSLDWETDEMIYLMNVMDNSLSNEEVLKMARSFK